jgi:hypothetical protein
MNNLHNRKDFIKIYEFGASEGGVGSKDGFANNAKLKDTYLGKLINGVFSPIGSLYKKSKALFVINRLSAQLVNELMRGVILFCFDNNIDLKTGIQENKEEEIKSNTDVEENDEEKVEDKSDVKEEALTKDEIKQKISELQKDINESNRKITTLKSTINTERYNIQHGMYSGKILVEKKQKLQNMIDNLHDMEEGLKYDEEQLAKFKEMFKNGEKTGKSSKFDSIKQACIDKYDFEPTAENLPNIAKGLGSISSTEFDQKFQKISTNTIKIGDEFTTIIDGNIVDITVSDVNTVKNIVLYKNEAGQMMEVSPIRLLPKGFPNFDLMKNDVESFLNKYASMYDSLTDDNKKKLEILYMNYMQLIALKQHQKGGLFESLSYLLNEDTLVRNIGNKLSNIGTTKVTMDNPQAGKIGVGRSLATKVGFAITVSDILTKRDKEKYKEKEDSFNFDIHNINLAEIEKTIVGIEKSNPGSDIKLKVSTYVNPYNLKTIQLSADQLLLKQTSDGKTDDSLKIRWDKEVTKTYAAFTNLMDIENVNIIKSDYGGGLNNKKIETSVKYLTGKIGSQKAIAEIQTKLPIQTDIVNFKSLGTGLWCYGSINYKSVLYNISVAPVSSAFKQQIGLIQIPMAFDNVDTTNHTSIRNQDFDKLFKTKNNELNKTNISYINVYFIIKNGQVFPQSTKTYTFPIYVLNEYIYSDGTSQIFLKSNINNANNVLLTDNLLTNFNSNAYLHKIEALAFSKFNEIDFDEWKPAFNFSTNQKDYNYNDFQKNKPKFLQVDDTKKFSILKKLSDTL